MRNLLLLSLLAAGCAKAGAATVVWTPDTDTRTRTATSPVPKGPCGRGYWYCTGDGWDSRCECLPEIRQDAGPPDATDCPPGYWCIATATQVSTETKISMATEELPLGYALRAVNELCESRDGTGDLEPCQWQKRTDAAAKAREESERDAKACRAKGCRVEHFSDSQCDGTGLCWSNSNYRGPNQRMWACNCDWKPAKPASTKGARP